MSTKNFCCVIPLCLSLFIAICAMDPSSDGAFETAATQEFIEAYTKSSADHSFCSLDARFALPKEVSESAAALISRIAYPSFESDDVIIDAFRYRITKVSDGQLCACYRYIRTALRYRILWTTFVGTGSKDSSEAIEARVKYVIEFEMRITKQEMIRRGIWDDSLEVLAVPD